MKKYFIFPLLSLLFGAGGFALRTMQNRTGFEAGTGLPVPGNPYALVLPVMLVLAALAFVLLSRILPGERGETFLRFQDYFSSDGSGIPTLLITGIFLWLLSGGYDAYLGLTISFSRLNFLLGVLTVFTAASQLPVVAACRRGAERQLNGNLLLIPVAYLVIRLVLAYREDSINPALTAYYVDLLALVFLILVFYRVSSFAFQSGRTRRFSVYAALAVVLCLTTLADGHTLSGLLFYGGSALWALGLMLLRGSAFRRQESISESGK